MFTFRNSKAIFNLDPRGEILPPRVKLATGEKLTPRGEDYLFAPSILLNSRECSTLGLNEGVGIPRRSKDYPGGQTSPLGASSCCKTGLGSSHKTLPQTTEGLIAELLSAPGLPDFSWYNIPIREKYTK
jgi:hypothetical protein